MKKGFLKCIAVLMIVIMTAAYFPMTDVSDIFSLEASAITNGNVSLGGNVKWSYDKNSKTITVSGSGAMKNFSNGDDGQRWDELVLGSTQYPNKHAEKIVINSGVTSIGNNAFRDLKSVKSVSVPSTVTSIGDSAFEGCSALTTVNIPSSVTSIGANAFRNTSAAKLTVPASVTSIGAGAFSGISDLKISCAYASEAYNYCLRNSLVCQLPENVLVSDVSYDTAKKQISVVLKLVYNKADFNAGNFTFTYNSAVKPVSTETEYTTVNDVSKAIVYNGSGKISIAVMAQDKVPYSSAGICEYTLAELKFNVNGQADRADFAFTADVLMFNNARTSVNSVSKNVDLHVYSETVKRVPTCSKEGLKSLYCSLCGKKTEVAIPVDSSKHGSTEIVKKAAATCVEAGYTGDTVCKDCGAVLTAGSVIPANGVHDRDETGTCTVCGNVANITVSFKDNTGFSVDNDAKIVVIRKTLKAEELSANIASGSWTVTDAAGNALEGTDAVKTGSLLKASGSDAVYTVIILGDVNSDGKVNAADARLVLRVASRIETGSGLFEIAADCDGKEKISASDARIVLRVASRLQTF